MEKVQPIVVRVAPNETGRVVVLDMLPVEQRGPFELWNAGSTTFMFSVDVAYCDYKKWYDAWIRGHTVVNDD